VVHVAWSRRNHEFVHSILLNLIRVEVDIKALFILSKRQVSLLQNKSITSPITLRRFSPRNDVAAPNESSILSFCRCHNNLHRSIFG
jgi:hypothetical protein